MDNPDNTLMTIKSSLNDVAHQIFRIAHDDIPELGRILNACEAMESESPDWVDHEFTTVLRLSRRYIERVVLGEEKNMEPLKDGVTLMRAMVRRFAKGEAFSFETRDVIDFLQQEAEKIEEPVAERAQEAPSSYRGVRALETEDMEILSDFILESRENLESIELNLIDLEESPDDKEIINAIFRPFHTLKGISGFLDLRKINVLAHATENLLDSARMGKCVIDNQITDVILQSVDVLKQLIDSVEKGLKAGVTADDRDIDIKTLAERIEEINTALSAEEIPRMMGEILVERGVLEEKRLTAALDFQTENPQKKLGEILVEEEDVEPREVISALREQKRGRKAGVSQVKVDTNKLDNLVDLTGELVIAQSMLRQEAFSFAGSSQKTLQNLSQLGQIVSNIQKIAMSMRMVPISSTFQKMVRLVRDVAKSCKKDVALIMSGEETEIDRNVVEALYEPMVHMIRNSIDHGLESMEERRLCGKPEKGTVSLRAYHKGGNIVIEIADDGKGLNTQGILEKAVTLGFVDANADLDDADIHQMIMKPGFSTAKSVTDISGRGVGMDVVKKSIDNLNGRLSIQSREGKGSTFTITLPLTLAIIEGMLVRVGHEKFIVPTMAILESFRPKKEEYYTIEGKAEMLMFRKSLVPVIRLSQICNVEMDHREVWKNIAIVVENNKEQRCILIDELLGKEEYVIKSLGESLEGIKGLAGGAIMGDGKVGLILDIAGLFEVALSL
jgi:two-component system chemotaxis sensor kinase CheA